MPPLEVLVLGAVQGLGVGLAGCGIVLAFRASRVLNLAHGAIGALGAVFVAYGVQRWALPYWVLVAVALAGGALAGALLEIGVVRRLRRAPPFMALVATLGAGQLLLVLAAALELRLVPGEPLPEPSGLPVLELGALRLAPSSVGLLVAGPAAVAGLALLLERTWIGTALRAAADNPDQARALGIRAGRLAALAWALAGALAVLTAVLVLPATAAGATTGSGTGLLLRALAAAALARMVSLPGALLAGCGLGAVEQAAIWVAPGSGLAEAVLFTVVAAAVALRPAPLGRLAAHASWAIFARPEPLRAPARVLATGGVGLVMLAMTLPGPQLVPLVSAVSFALLGLSVWIVVAGTGELPLAHAAAAGVGAAAAVSVGGGPPGLVAAALAGALAVVLGGATMLRVTGLGTTAVTLTFAALAQALVVVPVLGAGRPLPAAFGGGVRGAAVLAAVVLCAALWSVRALARGPAGVRVLALRDDRRAAEALGVDTGRVRLALLAASGLLAGVSGPLLAGALPAVAPAAFGLPAAIDAVAVAVLGGLGTSAGPVLGAAYVSALPAFVDLPTVARATSAVGWLVLVLYLPKGLSVVLGPLRRARPARPVPRPGRPPLPAAAAPTGVGLTLAEVSCRFGAVVALDAVTLRLDAGEVVALVGPNGAGKTTLLDVAGGTTRPDRGRVLIEGRDVTRLPAHRRAALGVARAWQESARFDTLTVREVLGLAGDPSAAALFGLEGLGEARLAELSTGQRRALELATVLARRPRLLLLDEPSAGLAQGEVAALAVRLRELRTALGLTVLVVEHDLALVDQIADRVVRLDGGRVSEAVAA